MNDKKRGQPPKDPKKKKVTHTTRLSPWVKAKVVKKCSRKGADNQSVETEKALISYNQWEEPK